MSIPLTRENFIKLMDEAEGNAEQQQKAFQYFLVLIMLEIKDILGSLDLDLQNVNDVIRQG